MGRMEEIIEVIEDLWKNYYNSDRKQIKPPTLDRIARALQSKSGGEFVVVRREVKDYLASGSFVKVREKDNCGISWNCYCWKESVYLQECLSSKNRVQ